MNEIITIGVDLAKNVFQVHGVDADGAVVVRRQLRRHQVLAFFKKQPPCLVGMEACATAHYWAREIAALGHEVKLSASSWLRLPRRFEFYRLPMGSVQVGVPPLLLPQVNLAGRGRSGLGQQVLKRV